MSFWETAQNHHFCHKSRSKIIFSPKKMSEKLTWRERTYKRFNRKFKCNQKQTENYHLQGNLLLDQEKNLLQELYVCVVFIF